ncbi:MULTISPECIES: DNA-processing protein DprA [Pseudomonas]|uniref:DNA-processing protein DprA n=1 Tax=Pseudomonas TaxID=286 RepID=UPI000CE5D4BE|nr:MULTISPECIES: DNA-processing protein DprA [Pseudomonas]AVD91489.1 DNA processing protein DprA [Pseudomonas sp. SWI36]MDD2043690.1 DNA-protecting protein DprA [Pseudomonas putida]MDH1551731.1 DNA-protecting protein DprA [Pseudomonas juntendi]
MLLDQLTHDHQRLAWMHAVLVLSKKIGIGSAKANDDLRKSLLQAGSLENIYNDHFTMIPVEEDVGLKVFEKIKKFTAAYDVVTCLDERYPKVLLDYPGTPPVLYFQGDLALASAEKTIGFVGTRELFDETHRDHGRRVVRRLARSGFEVVVSGLAEGSDTLGHETAIQNGGRTIAVLGTPLNMHYPKSNAALQDEIAARHLVVTEYPIGIGSFGSYFANRNRTTVALSSGGIVVARASDKSGTQHAIRICLEQNKPVYVLENNIRESSYTWVVKNKDRIKVIRENFDAGDSI